MNASKIVTRLGIDLGKNSFHLWGVDAQGSTVLRRKVARGQLLKTVANLPPCLIGMEACGGAHHWARELGKLGHEVRLMAPQFVKPYVKGNKNDYNDAEGICEAVGRPNMRFVAVKSIEQQDLQGLHRMRAAVDKTRTAHSNHIRGLLGEYGIAVNKGTAALRRALPELLEDAENGLSPLFRSLLAPLYEQLTELDRRLADYDRQIGALARNHEACRRLAAVEGIGPIGATALVASFGDARQFANARQFSAALGLVPAQHSTGGKAQLLGISKRGDRYLRTLLVHGARSAINAALTKDKDDPRSRWVKQVVARRGKNRATVALANKNARIVWALLSRGDTYRAAA